MRPSGRCLSWPQLHTEDGRSLTGNQPALHNLWTTNVRLKRVLHPSTGVVAIVDHRLSWHHDDAELLFGLRVRDTSIEPDSGMDAATSSSTIVAIGDRVSYDAPTDDDSHRHIFSRSDIERHWEIPSQTSRHTARLGHSAQIPDQIAPACQHQNDCSLMDWGCMCGIGSLSRDLIGNANPADPI